MTDDNSGLSDEVFAELNPAGPEPDYGPQAAPIPDRPADGASKAEWAAYVIALGSHPDEVEKYSRQQLKDLADRFGG